MIDARILAAVLVTLAAGTAITGGSIPSGENLDLDTDIPGKDLIKGIDGLNPESSLVEGPEPETYVEADLQLSDMEKRDIPVKNGKVSLDAGNISIEHRALVSEENFNLEGFDGSVEIVNNTTTLAGSAELIETNKVVLNGSTTLEKEISSGEIKVRNTTRTPISLEKVRGVIESEAGKTNITSEETLVIDSYTGNMTVNSKKQQIHLEGRANQLEIGKFSLGQ